MTDIGVKELKARASQIVRNVRQRRSRYVVTYRGRPVAMLVPLDVPEPAAGARRGEAGPADAQEWGELIRLGRELAKTWPAGRSSADALSEMRR
jgi:prevent-host-death family protein